MTKLIKLFLILCMTTLTLIGYQSRGIEAKPYQREDLKLDLYKVINHQPNFKADISVKTNSQVIKMKIAKKGVDFRLEMKVPYISCLPEETKRLFDVTNAIIFRDGKMFVILFPSTKEYIEPEKDLDEEEIDLVLSSSLNKNIEENIDSCLILGKTTVNGSTCIKVRYEDKENKTTNFFYIAQDLHNLIIKYEATDKTGKGSITLSNVCFDVPSALFEIPKDYKRFE